MDFQTLKQSWNKSFEATLSSIEKSLTPQDDDYPDVIAFKTLCKWLIETEHSPYDFLPNGYQGYRYNPYDTDSLFNLIHHALIDDGEISFVNMLFKEKVIRVFIMFRWHNEENFHDLCFEENSYFIKRKIASATRMAEFKLSMKDKYPDKPFIPYEVPSEKDFTFVGHYNPIQFISDVEALAQQQAEDRKKGEEIRAKFLKTTS